MSTEFNPNYKRSEVGFIPKDWKITPISSLLEINCPITYGVVQPGKNDKGGVLFIRGGDVYDGKIDIANLRRISHSISKAYRRTLLRGGEILISLVGFPGESAIVPKALAGSNIARQVALVRLANESGGDPEYICHFLRSPMGKSILLKEAFGSAQQVINLRDINKLQLPLPCTMAEQRAIATALSDMDALISGLDQLIAKKRDIKQAAMQQLLTGQTRLPGFSGEWEVKRLGDIAEIDPESLPGNTAKDYTFKYISLENVDAGRLIGFSEVVFSNAPSRARRKLRRNDVLISTVRPNLMSHLLFSEAGEGWVCSTGFSVVRCGDGVVHPEYIFACFFGGIVNRQIDKIISGSNYPSINSADVNAIEIPTPSFSEQTAIATILSEMDAELAGLEIRRDKAKQLKQGMMQELLTGRIRLV